MAIKTTVNLMFSQSSLLYAAAQQFDVPVSSIINSLARKIFKSVGETSTFPLQTLRSFCTVQYQPVLTDDSDCWEHVPVSFQEDVHEKCQDLRKIFKVSVSLALAFAINKYLDELIRELKGEKESDNYTSNYFIFVTDDGSFKHITLLWDVVEPEKLQEIYELHRKT